MLNEYGTSCTCSPSSSISKPCASWPLLLTISKLPSEPAIVAVWAEAVRGAARIAAASTNGIANSLRMVSSVQGRGALDLRHGRAATPEACQDDVKEM